MKISRRAVLACACRVPLAAALAVLGACAEKKQTAQCTGPDQLSNDETSLRASVQYTEESADPTKTCSGCAFFLASSGAGECGGCQILNGSVSVNGHCTSWSAQA